MRPLTQPAMAIAGTLCLFCANLAFAAETHAPTGSPAILPGGAALHLLWNGGEFTEGVAAGPDGRIYFSDIPRGDAPGKVYRYDPRTNQTAVYCADSGKSNGLMFDRQGRLIAACGANGGRRALCEITAEGTVRELVSTVEGKRFNSPNDLVIHPDGGIYFSDPRYVGAEPVELDHMSVFRFDPATGSVRRVTGDITKPNGVILSPDGKTLYVAETDNGRLNLAAPGEPAPVRMTLNAFPVNADGSLGRKQLLVDFGAQTGIDGMTMDRTGHIYGALRREDRFGIAVFNPAGQEMAFIPTPELPTNCCFGIADQSSTLYITAGGGLYRITLNPQGYHPSLAEH